MKRKLVITLMVIILTISMGLLVGCRNGEADNFVDDCVKIVLTKEATFLFLDYEPEDFAEVGAIEVEDLTALTVEWVKKKYLGIPTEQEMLINLENYRRILKIILPIHSKRNVLKAKEILEQRSDVEIVSFSYLIDMGEVLS